MHIIYVDDEKPALNNFRLTVASILEIESITTFQSGQAALDWAEDHLADVAFLDIEMPGIGGLELAKALKNKIPSIRIVFVTAYSQYALDAWGVDAMGYLLKPYAVSDILKELAKCSYTPLPSQSILINTIPNFSVTIDGHPLSISGAKPREPLALLVDRGSRGLTTGEGISCLWPEKPSDVSSQSLFRMTYKRLADSLEEAGVSHLIESKDNRRYLQVDRVDCDLYRILAGDRNTMKKYNGQYMQEYSWAEERNGQLYHLIFEQ